MKHVYCENCALAQSKGQTGWRCPIDGITRNTTVLVSCKSYVPLMKIDVQLTINFKY